jgi:hypothetical protein
MKEIENRKDLIFGMHEINPCKTIMVINKSEYL